MRSPIVGLKLLSGQRQGRRAVEIGILEDEFLQVMLVGGGGEKFRQCTLCHVLEVSRSDYYEWLKRLASAHEREGAQLRAEVEPNLLAG